MKIIYCKLIINIYASIFSSSLTFSRLDLVFPTRSYNNITETQLRTFWIVPSKKKKNLRKPRNIFCTKRIVLHSFHYYRRFTIVSSSYFSHLSTRTQANAQNRENKNNRKTAKSTDFNCFQSVKIFFNKTLAKKNSKTRNETVGAAADICTIADWSVYCRGRATPHTDWLELSSSVYLDGAAAAALWRIIKLLRGPPRIPYLTRPN